MKVGGVAGDDYGHRCNADRRRPEHDAQVTLDNETMREPAGVRSYSYLLTTVPGIQSNITDVNTGPVFAIFPVHGGRGVESRLTVEGMNISNPPGGNQPPNYTADIGNATEVTVQTAGGLGENETGGVQMNIVPKQGGNTMSGLVCGLRLLGRHAVEQLTPPTCRRAAPGRRTRRTTCYDVNAAVGGPIMKDKLWYYMNVRSAGVAPQHPERLLQQERGRRDEVSYAPDFNQPAYSTGPWENYTPRITWQASAKNKFSFSWDEQPVCRTCTGTASLSGSPSSTTAPEADGHGEFSPQRVQTAAGRIP